MVVLCRWILALSSVVAGAALPVMARAQNYPTHTVTIIVPYAPGGMIDLVGRIIQPQLQAELGQPVVLDNRGGAG
jgi:tripartite-type tricarboxylate transporter receptor subunit TctC